MTIDGWGLDYVARGVKYLGEKVVEYGAQTPTDEGESNALAMSDYLDKLVESVSSSICVAMLAMKPPGTRIRIRNNIILFEEPSMKSKADRTFATWFGTDDTANRQVFKKYRIFDRIIMCHDWYESGEEGAKAIARIHQITLKGMDEVTKTYKDDYVPDHVKKYAKKITKFTATNGFSESMAEVDPKLNQDPDIDEFQSVVIQKQANSDYDTDDDVLSEISEDDRKVAVMASDSKGSKLMKQVYGVKELINFADRLEVAWEHFQSDDDLVKGQVQDELNGIAKDLKTKVKLYQQLMKRDVNSRY